ncbi:MAG: response regulator [Desulfobacteraceae bacterium]|nr:response regulator [Desulfobacteraceae bacterium]
MSGPIRVLLVDDEVLFVKTLIKILSKRNMAVQGVTDGSAAIELLRSSEADPFDVVVLDMRMPGMDGLETIRAIRELTSSLPVIFLTGGASVKSISQALKSGVDEVLLKPCPIDTLVATIENVYERMVYGKEL